MNADARVFDVQHVSRTYRHVSGSVTAVEDASFMVSKGEFLAIVGPSGSGKSTLLHLLGAIDHPESGRVVFDGTDLAQCGGDQLTAIRRSRLGFVFQSFNLVPVLSAYENVEYGLWLTGVSRDQRRARVESALEQVGLAHRRDHRPDHLSGGERQRVAIARALVTRPAVVLADEPTANLDSKTAHQIVDLLLELNRAQGTVIVFATHDRSIIDAVPRIIELTDGRITADRHGARG